MYVHWKVLIGLGISLWSSLCLFDYYFINPETKTFYYSEEDAMKWAKEDYDNLYISDKGYGFGFTFILWNILTFLSTIIICFALKLAILAVSKLREKLRWYVSLNFSRWSRWLLDRSERKLLETKTLFNTECVKSNTSLSSKIPVPSKSSMYISIDFNREKEKDVIESCVSLLSNSTISLDRSSQPGKSDMSSHIEKQVEKRCAKLRDEMIIQQSNSLKEHSALSRRLEHVAREKRDLSRQLVILQKENRAAKQQLEELIDEKELLLKRLHCASKEFRDNTKSRKIALAKLEEAEIIINQLKEQLKLATNEKEVLEQKIKILDSKETCIGALISKTESSHETFDSKSKSCPDSRASVMFKKLSVENIDETQDEVHKVEKRLMKLEESLNSLKLSKKPKSEIAIKSDSTTNQTFSENSDFEMPNNTLKKSQSAELPALESDQNSENLPLENDNLMEEERRKLLDPIDSSGDEGYATIQNADHLMDYTIEDSFERVGSILNYIKCAPKTPRNKLEINNYSDESPGNDLSTTNEEGEEETDGWSTSTKGIVSKSPAFQKFLRNMDNSDYHESKVMAMTRVF